MEPAFAANADQGAKGKDGIGGEERRVIVASALGTVFEWYDFYLYGSLASIIARKFFSGLDDRGQLVFALLAFSAGFAVRPLGAILFGRHGDLFGRKHAFLVTIVVMGLSSALVGVLPSYASVGIAAPIALVALRLLQGLALGGEYGGAATYVAEHAPAGRRGLFTSWIQTTATLGLVLSLVVVVGCRFALGEAFEEWGWRLPFLLSSVLLAVSVYVRVRLRESPVFRRMKEQGTASTTPVRDALRWGNFRVLALALFGGVAGQAVVWYTGTFYALFFLEHVLRLEPQAASLMVALALALATPFFVLFGALSDRIGRKKVVLAGCALAALTFFPVFKGLTRHGNPASFRAARASPVVVVADEGDCSLQLDPLQRRRSTSSCDVAKSWLAGRAVPYRTAPAPPGAIASVRIGAETVVDSFDGSALAPAELSARLAAFEGELEEALASAGYRATADMREVNATAVVLLLFVLALYVTMVYGPIAAWLVELFPARVRYTSVSLPYHLGNGWFGGFLPSVAFAMVAATGDIHHGLWYPVVVAVATTVIGTMFMPETKDREIHHPG